MPLPKTQITNQHQRKIKHTITNQAPAAILTVLPPERDISYEHDATRTHVNVQYVIYCIDR